MAKRAASTMVRTLKRALTLVHLLCTIYLLVSFHSKGGGSLLAVNQRIDALERIVYIDDVLLGRKPGSSAPDVNGGFASYLSMEGNIRVPRTREKPSGPSRQLSAEERLRLLEIKFGAFSGWGANDPYFAFTISDDSCNKRSDLREQGCTPDKPLFDRKCPGLFDHEICLDDLPSKGEPCLVYDLGIRRNPEFGETLAKSFGCTVHAFDPSPISLKFHADGLMDDIPNYTFHGYGAGGVDGYVVLEDYDWDQVSIIRSDGGGVPGPLHSLPVKTLKTILTELGHLDTYIDVLKVDVEGSEFAFFEEAFDTLGCSWVDNIGQTADTVGAQRRTSMRWRLCWRYAGCGFPGGIRIPVGSPRTKTEGSKSATFKTSDTIWLASEKGTSHNAWDTSSATSQKLQHRAFDLLRVPFQHDMSDGLQVLRYEPGQAYLSHHDYLAPQDDRAWNFNPAKGGSNRFATVFLYLQAPEAGGQTVFPNAPENPFPVREVPTDLVETLFPDKTRWERTLMRHCYEKLNVVPKPQSAVLFYSQTGDGSLDPYSLHGACPPLKGTKWGANLWVWNRRRHGLGPQIPTPEPRKPVKTEKTLRVTFINEEGSVVELMFGDNVMRTLEAGEQISYDTYVGHQWTARFKEGRKQFWKFRVDLSHERETISITSATTRMEGRDEL